MAARDVWNLNRQLVAWQTAYFDELLGSFGISTNDCRTLKALEPGTSYSMGSVARLWSSDSSTTTWVANRLERKGFVSRSPGSDRRVRVIALTEEGEKMRARLIDALDSPPPYLDGFSRSDLELLRDALARLVASLGVQPGDT
jgi:DNA-binding MarR family transcriptional regulator